MIHTRKNTTSQIERNIYGGENTNGTRRMCASVSACPWVFIWTVLFFFFRAQHHVEDERQHAADREDLYVPTAPS